MAFTPVSSSRLIFLFFLATTFAAGASAATFTIKNNCSYTVWPAAIPVGGGTQLDPGQTWTVRDVPVGTSSTLWGRTGCSFNGTSSSGHCATGDCAGALNCTVAGKAPVTQAEFTTTMSRDYYDIDVIDGYNLPIAFSCSTGVRLVCTSRTCRDGCLYANDDCKDHACSSNSNYQLTFCP